MERPVSYEGKENYIFISYSHKDSARVWPIISRMQKDGFRIWYDDGIDPGSEWDENIARHVKECSFFIAFMSENYLASDNCKDELNYSRDLDKQQLIIYLDKVELPPALAMRIGRNQAIMKYNIADENEFFGKLYDAQGIEYQHKDNTTPRIVLERPQEVHITEPSRKKNIIPLLIAALLLSAVIGGVMWFMGRNNPSGSGDVQVNGTTSAEDSATASTASGESGELTPADSVVIYDKDDIIITALGIDSDSRYITLKLSIENKTKKEVYVYGDVFYINGFGTRPRWPSAIVSPGVPVYSEVIFSREEIGKYNIDLENITSIKTYISGYFTDNSASLESEWIEYYPYGEENAKPVEYIPSEDDFVLMDTEEVMVAVRRSDSYDELENYADYWYPEYILVNKTDEEKMISIVKQAFNGYATGNDLDLRVKPNTIYTYDDFFDETKYSIEEYGKTLMFSGEIYVGPSSEKWKEGKKTQPFTIYPEGEEAAKAWKPRELKPEQIIYQDEKMLFAYLGTEVNNSASIDLYYAINLSDTPLTAQLQTQRLWETDEKDGYAYGEEKFLYPGNAVLWDLSFIYNHLPGNAQAETYIRYWEDDESSGYWDYIIVDLYEITE